MWPIKKKKHVENNNNIDLTRTHRNRLNSIPYLELDHNFTPVFVSCIFERELEKYSLNLEDILKLLSKTNISESACDVIIPLQTIEFSRESTDQSVLELHIWITNDIEISLSCILVSRESNADDKRNTALVSAISSSSAVIDFYTDGTIKDANQIFLSAVGFERHEIIGLHHRIFCHDEFYDENQNFWLDLSKGQIKSGLFKRKNKFGDTIWLDATYHPVYEDGVVTRIVKIAQDATARVKGDERMQRIVDSSRLFSKDMGLKIKDICILFDGLSNKNVMTNNSLNQSKVKVDDLMKNLSLVDKSIHAVNSMADKTNLLSLNASIEAARAGEYGKGFSVVASEVRNLSQTTKKITAEITDLLTLNSDASNAVDEQIRLLLSNSEEINAVLVQLGQEIEKVRTHSDSFVTSIVDL